MEDLVEKHWPHVTALARLIDALEAKSITINTAGTPDIPRIVEGLREHGKREPLRLPA